MTIFYDPTKPTHGYDYLGVLPGLGAPMTVVLLHQPTPRKEELLLRLARTDSASASLEEQARAVRQTCETFTVRHAAVSVNITSMGALVQQVFQQHLKDALHGPLRGVRLTEDDTCANLHGTQPTVGKQHLVALVTLLTQRGVFALPENEDGYRLRDALSALQPGREPPLLVVALGLAVVGGLPVAWQPLRLF